jgi:hypothetical protein
VCRCDPLFQARRFRVRSDTEPAATPSGTPPRRPVLDSRGGLVSSKQPVGWGAEGDDLLCPSTQTARPVRSRQRHHSKSGGVGRLWSKDRAPSCLNSRHSVDRPMRPKLVGVANRFQCGAGENRLSTASHHAVPGNIGIVNARRSGSRTRRHHRVKR